MTLRRRGARAIGAVSVGVVLVALAPSPALADDELGLSLDGVTWAEDLTTPLFDPGFVWVPGEADVVTLHIRNQSGQQASAVAEVVLGPGGEELAADLDVRTRFGGGAWTAGLTSPPIVLAAGQVVTLDVEVTFDPASGNETQLQVVPLTVRVRLSGQDTPVGQPTSTTAPPTSTTGPQAPSPGGPQPPSPAAPQPTPGASPRPPGG